VTTPASGGVRHGTFVPQGWKLEYSGIGAADAWARSVSLAQLAERLGYDHLWVYDHVETTPRREPAPVFEAFTMLAGLAPQVPRVGLGQLVTCAFFRPAGLLAKQAACLDVISGGRLILGLGAGWYEEEADAYGLGFRSPRERLRVLDETLAAVRQLWAAPAVTFDGQYVHLTDAHCDPKPLQQLPPIWVGGGGEQVNLRIAARLADATNWQVGLDDFVRKSALLDRYCSDLGRDPATVARTHGPDAFLFDTEADMRRWLASPAGGHLRRPIPVDEWARDNFVGTVDMVVEKAQAFVDAGCSAFVNWYRDFPSSDSMEGWMSDVVPQLSVPAGAPVGGGSPS
jgi:alkanesulfonate monooxygenase SsuD/methylene tetrahydromethanopterin reductase-like flavin-dependent oxidoreductase (luciferase family)